MGRSPCCDKSKVKRGSWSVEEDATLKNYLTKHGPTGNWIALPQKAGLRRCGKSCRLRWLNYLRPDIKHGGFTQEEEDTICRLYNEIGSRWSVIAAQLEGRTDNEVKNFWNTKLKKKLMRPDTNPPPAKSNTEIDTTSSRTSAATTTAVGTIFQASTNSPSSFSDPFIVKESFSSVVSYEPKLILEEGSYDFSSANRNGPLSTPHQEMPHGFEMDGAYGGANGISIDEGFVDYSNVDLFSIFQC